MLDILIKFGMLAASVFKEWIGIQKMDMQDSNRTFKQQAHALVDELPDNATWYDLIFRAGECHDRELGHEANGLSREPPDSH